MRKRKIPVGYKRYPHIDGAGGGWYAPGGHPGWGADPVDGMIIMTKAGPVSFDRSNPDHCRLANFNPEEIVSQKVSEENGYRITRITRSDPRSGEAYVTEIREALPAEE